jgi:putative membrane-bound dehydrogenase-like protein
VYEKSTVFATNLAWPTAIFCYNGGVFVAATPDILFLKDTNGDGKADQREAVFTGFASGSSRINVQELLNSFVWGLDNRIHGSSSGEGGVIRALRHQEAGTLDLHGRDFVIEPRGLTMTSEAGGGQHGLSFDDSGRRFTCNNSDNIRLFMYDDSYGSRNPFYSMPSPLVSIAVDGPAAEVYRISPDEPWRVVRTRWRVGGLVSGPIEGGGRVSGYFTAATGLTVYRGSAYPATYRGNAFIADCAGNLIHRKVLVPDGAGLKAERPADEQKVEFAASRDTWFRPVQFAAAPDGTLYVIDMYREIIEHPWSLPENIKKLLDLNSGSNRGRIYRIAPDGFKAQPQTRLSRSSTADLVAMLGSKDGWHRDTASRLLYQKQDPGAVPLLIDLLEHSQVPLARLHALTALEGLGALSQPPLRLGLQDSDAMVRERAIKLSEPFLSSKARNAQILATLEQLADDPAIRVRYQLAFTMGTVPGEFKVTTLAALARHDAGDPWVKSAILSSLAEGAGEVFRLLVADNQFSQTMPGQEFLRDLVVIIGANHKSEEVRQVLEFIDHAEVPALRFGLVTSIAEGLKRGGASPDLVRKQFDSALASATELAGDVKANEQTRLSAIQLLGFSSFNQSGSLLLSLLDQSDSQAVQLSAVSALTRFSDPGLAPALTNVWKNLTPRLRSEVITVLLARPERALVLLQAIKSGYIQPAILGTTQRKFLHDHRDATVSRTAAEVLDASAPTPRQAVIDRFQPSLSLTGHAEAGKKIYEERCISCHRLGSEGHQVGPDLATVKSNGKEKLLVNILDPNREVPPQYVSYDLETKDGDSFIGLIVNESSDSVTVRQAYGKEEVIPRRRIASMRSQSQSLMPEGLEAGLSEQDLANLLQHIVSAETPKVP